MLHWKIKPKPGERWIYSWFNHFCILQWIGDGHYYWEIVYSSPKNNYQVGNKVWWSMETAFKLLRNQDKTNG
jgi:hypothetical protein